MLSFPFAVSRSISKTPIFQSPMSSSSSKTLTDFFRPANKRLKPSPPPAEPPRNISAVPKESNSGGEEGGGGCGSGFTPEQEIRMELSRGLAKARRNSAVCKQRVSGWNSAEGLGHLKLEELLVEESWMEALPGEFQKPYAKNLFEFVEKEIRNGSIYPPPHLIFNALNSTPFDRVKTVIIGQDPYHGPGQAMGLSFSVPDGIKVPSSLVNIYKELQKDLSCSIPSHGNLERWAVQGVLLLNAVLTVRQHQANSHAKKGWEQFTDSVIETISKKKRGVVFLLWGNYAQAKSRLIDESKHHILKAAHPSGLSANRGFFGCRHFSRTNQILEKMGIAPINWQV